MAFLNYKMCLLALLCVGLVIENVSARARPSDDYDDWISDEVEEAPKEQPPQPPAPVPEASENNESESWDSPEEEVKPAAPVRPPAPVVAKDSFESEEEEVKPPAPVPPKDSFESEEEVKPPAPVPPNKDSFESEEEVKPPAPAPAKDSFESEEEEVKPPAPAPAKDSFESEEEEVKPAASVPAKDSFEASDESEEEVKAKATVLSAAMPASGGAQDSFGAEESKEAPKQSFHAKTARLTAAQNSEEEWSDEENTFIAPVPLAPVAPAPAPPAATGATNNHHHHHVNHKDDHDHDTEAVNPLGPGPVTFGSGTPIVHAEFNASCGFEETSGRCDPGRNMECSATTNKCVCKSSYHVYIPEARQCLQVSSRATSYSCTYNEQCHSEDSLGPLSLCNTETSRCECLKTSGGPLVVHVDGKCHYQKYIGDGCPDDDHKVCSITLPNSICIYRPANNTEPAITVIDPNSNMVCLCDEGWVHDPTQPKPEECQPVGKDESSPCKFDAQCTAGIGALSRCFANKCQCVNMGGGEAVFYKGVCYPRLALGDVCQSDDQCKASIHDNAVCAEHESYLVGEKVCHCPDGKKCDGNGANAFSTPSLTILLANLIIMTVGATKVLQF